MSRHHPPRLPLLIGPNDDKPRGGPSQINNTSGPRASSRLRICVLGSGSAGNSTVVTLDGRAMLVDAGFGPRTTAARLRGTGLAPADIHAIVLTHLDRDHFRLTWFATLIRYRIALWLHRKYLGTFERIAGVQRLQRARLVRVFDGQPFEPITALRTTAIHLPHDVHGTTGFLFESDAGRIGYATDLGRVPTELIQRFAAVDVLAIESNYDPRMQRASGRPAFLVRRIMDGRGHLSNQQAFEAVRRIVEHDPSGRPDHILLLHRSQQCNRPQLVRQVFDADERIGPRVVLTEQHRRSQWLDVAAPPARRPRQLAWAF